jgi:hypothetical protein
LLPDTDADADIMVWVEEGELSPGRKERWKGELIDITYRKEGFSNQVMNILEGANQAKLVTGFPLQPTLKPYIQEDDTQTWLG